MIFFWIQVRARTAQFFQRLATGWTIRGSNFGGGEILHYCPDRHWKPATFLYNKFWVSFPRVNQHGLRVDQPPTSSAELNERVQQYLYTPPSPPPPSPPAFEACSRMTFTFHVWNHVSHTYKTKSKLIFATAWSSTFSKVKEWKKIYRKNNVNIPKFLFSETHHTLIFSRQPYWQILNFLTTPCQL